MAEQKKVGPFELHPSGTKSFHFLQNPTTNGFSDGYSIRYVSNTCGNKNGWLSFGTVKEAEIPTAKKTIFVLYNLLMPMEENEEDFINKCKHIFRKNKSTTKLIMGNIERKVDYEWIPLINSFIDELYEKDSEDLTVKLEEQSKLIGDE